MKIRSTVFWPENDPPVVANEVIDVADDVAAERIKAGLAVEFVEEPAETQAA